MKKISLKEVKNGLSRDEMRAISGGSGCSANDSGMCGVPCVPNNSSFCKRSCPCENSICTYKTYTC